MDVEPKHQGHRSDWPHHTCDAVHTEAPSFGLLCKESKQLHSLAGFPRTRVVRTSRSLRKGPTRLCKVHPVITSQPLHHSRHLRSVIVKVHRGRASGVCRVQTPSVLDGLITSEHNGREVYNFTALWYFGLHQRAHGHQSSTRTRGHPKAGATWPRQHLEESHGPNPRHEQLNSKLEMGANWCDAVSGPKDHRQVMLPAGQADRYRCSHKRPSASLLNMNLVAVQEKLRRSWKSASVPRSGSWRPSRTQRSRPCQRGHSPSSRCEQCNPFRYDPPAILQVDLQD